MARIVHPLTLRLAHWSIAVATLAMILSGWRIYNASPLYGFAFPVEFSLGGWLAGALAWHFAMMWLLFAGLALHFSYSLLAGRFWRALAPPAPAEVIADVARLWRGALAHEPLRYSALQRFAYLCALALLLLAIASGFALWKPVQLHELADAFGGFEKARRAHFFAMVGLAGFSVGHIVLALRHKSALRTMTTGDAAEVAS